MSARKSSKVAALPVAAPVAAPVAPVAEFAMTDAVIAAASNVLGAASDLYRIEVAFHRAVFADVSAFELWESKGKIGGNGGAGGNRLVAAFDFVRHAYAVSLVGADCAAQLFDSGVGSKAIVTPSPKSRFGAQAKQALKNTVTGSKRWGRWLEDQVALATELEKADGLAAAEAEAEAAAMAAQAAINAADDAAARVKSDPTIDAVAAAMAAQAAINAADDAAARVKAVVEAAANPTKSSKREGSSDLVFLGKQLGAVVKRLSRDAEKFDGSFAFDRALPLANAIKDLMKSYGIK